MKQSQLRWIALCGCLGAAVLPAAAEIGCPADAPAARIAAETNARWVAAAASGEHARLAAMYAPDAVLMPPTDETIVGREPIARYLASSAPVAAPATYTVDVVGCALSGDTLEIAGVWGADETTGDARRLRTGNVMRVATRGPDGAWRLKYEIWN